MQNLIVVVLSLVFTTGCATGVTGNTRLTLDPKSNECQVSEVRPTVFSTLAISVCWDAEQRAIGMVGGPGKAAIAIPLEVIGSLSAIVGPVLGAILLGSEVQSLKPETTIVVGP